MKRATATTLLSEVSPMKWKGFVLFEVSFSWYCISREKETTCIELARCCFLIICFFTKRLLSSSHKTVSPLDLRIGMSVFRLLLGISEFFLILKLTPVWRNYTSSRHSCGPKQGHKGGSCMVLGCIYLTNPIFRTKMPEQGGAAALHLFPHAELWGYAFLLFLF